MYSLNIIWIAHKIIGKYSILVIIMNVNNTRLVYRIIINQLSVVKQAAQFNIHLLYAECNANYLHYTLFYIDYTKKEKVPITYAAKSFWNPTPDLDTLSIALETRHHYACTCFLKEILHFEPCYFKFYIFYTCLWF